MPKLAANVAREAEQAAQEDPYKLLPPGIYIGKLDSVEVSDDEGPSGFHFWTWKFKIMDEGYKGAEQAFITSLSPKARFSVGQAFAAFNVPADTHTDEICGQLAMLTITQQTIQKGNRAGQLGNQVQSLSPYDGSGSIDLEDQGGNGASAAQASDF
jgi:hypothetical protein